MDNSINLNLTGLIKTDTYRLYHSPYVVSHQAVFVEECVYLHNKLTSLYPHLPLKGREYSLEYTNTNIFSLCSLSVPFYRIFQQITASIRDWVHDDRPLWLNAWLNYNDNDSILDWHHHGSYNILHGYLSIDPKKTVTEFKHFSIKNEVGRLYIGLAGEKMVHRVVVKEQFEGYRTTLAFNVLDQLPSIQHRNILTISTIPIP